MDWVVTIAAILVVWSALRVLGNERQRLIDEQAAIAAAEAAAEQAAIAGAPTAEMVPVAG